MRQTFLQLSLKVSWVSVKVPELLKQPQHTVDHTKVKMPVSVFYCKYFEVKGQNMNGQSSQGSVFDHVDWVYCLKSSYGHNSGFLRPFSADKPRSRADYIHPADLRLVFPLHHLLYSPHSNRAEACNPNLVFLEELAYFYRERPLSRAWPQRLCRAPEHVTKESCVSYFKGKCNNQSRTRHDCAAHFV